MNRLKDKVALITGAAQGIGLAIAKEFAQEGATVIITDINDQDGTSAAQSLGENVHFLHLDVSQEAEWKKAMIQIEAAHGKLDILVNNAGIIKTGDGCAQDPEHCSLKEWQAIHLINMDSVFLGCKYAIGLMKKQTQQGSIINMSSRSGIVGVPHAAAYASSKASIRNHTKSVALYCAQQKYNIRCNSLHPAAIMTNMWNDILGDQEFNKKVNDVAKSIPVGHFGTPEDVAMAALYLASDESSYITGAELVIDGGILAGSSATPRDD
jgi:3(or 17)beta-hydroxysteroid dehydrogenase